MSLYTPVIQTYGFVTINTDHVVGTWDFQIHITRGHCDSCTNAQPDSGSCQQDSAQSENSEEEPTMEICMYL